MAKCNQLTPLPCKGLKHISLFDPTMHPTVRAVDFERHPCSDFRHVTPRYKLSYCY